MLNKKCAYIGLAVTTAAGALLTSAPAYAQSDLVQYWRHHHSSYHRHSHFNLNHNRPRIFIRIYIYNRNNNVAIANQREHQAEAQRQQQGPVATPTVTPSRPTIPALGASLVGPDVGFFSRPVVLPLAGRGLAARSALQPGVTSPLSTTARGSLPAVPSKQSVPVTDRSGQAVVHTDPGVVRHDLGVAPADLGKVSTPTDQSRLTAPVGQGGIVAPDDPNVAPRTSVRQ